MCIFYVLLYVYWILIENHVNTINDFYNKKNFFGLSQGFSIDDVYES